MVNTVAGNWISAHHILRSAAWQKPTDTALYELRNASQLWARSLSLAFLCYGRPYLWSPTKLSSKNLNERFFSPHHTGNKLNPKFMEQAIRSQYFCFNELDEGVLWKTDFYIFVLTQSRFLITMTEQL